MAKSRRKKTGIPLPENRGLSEFIKTAMNVKPFIARGNIHGKISNSSNNIS